MSTATLYVGDVFDVMATLADGSVDLVLTSPPFLALRSYLPADHPDKAKEVGSEPTPAEFLDTLLALTAEWGRLIAPYGSICVELGDTYAGGGSGPDSRYEAKGTVSSGDRWTGTRAGWPMDKSLCCIPALYEVALAYGINPLTGEPSPAGRWRVRNVVAWCRPNPAVGALGDKFRPATSYMTVATRARDRWFDLDAVRFPADPANNRKSEVKRRDIPGRTDQVCSPIDDNGQRIIANIAGAPPLDHWWHDDDVFEQDTWLVSTEPYPGSHYATWPRKLLDRPIKAMCPREVCTVCGEPRRRITERTPEYAAARASVGSMNDHSQDAVKGTATNNRAAQLGKMTAAQNVTLGWSDCGHDTYRPGIVLDPFAGSGTTLAVATGHGRTAIGIDIDDRNERLIRERVGMFLTDVVRIR